MSQTQTSVPTKATGETLTADELNDINDTLNDNASDAVSKGDTTPQNLASDVDFAAGKGVRFDGGDVFDAYEKTGNLTPTIETNGTGFDSVTYSAAVTGGKYMLVGGGIFFQLSLATDAITVGSASGVIVIGGLPLPCSNVGTAQGDYASVTIGSSLSWATNPTYGYIAGGSSSINLQYRATHGADSVNLPFSSVNTGVTENLIRISGWYPID